MENTLPIATPLEQVRVPLAAEQGPALLDNVRLDVVPESVKVAGVCVDHVPAFNIPPFSRHPGSRLKCFGLVKHQGSNAFCYTCITWKFRRSYPCRGRNLTLWVSRFYGPGAVTYWRRRRFLLVCCHFWARNECLNWGRCLHRGNLRRRACR